MLKDSDRQHLEENGWQFSTYPHGEGEILVIAGYELLAGYEPQTVELLIEVPSTYPDGKLDMWWVYPVVVFERTKQEPPGAQVRQAFAAYEPEPDRQWQRFSRHPEWRPGVDDLRSFLRSLRSTMETDAQQVAA
jgi:hypothetical protein